jgi:hypothetical protein
VLQSEKCDLKESDFSQLLFRVIKGKKKYHTVGTILKYHTVGTILKYHTVGTILKYHTVGTILK